MKTVASLPPLFATTLGLLALAAGSLLRAQAIAPTADPKPVEKEVVVLNPFVLTAEKDVGFVAASSLAGGRLADELKNTPAAYSVQTRDFLDALAITDLTEAAKWTVNAGTAQDQGTGEIFSYGTNSTTQILFRGAPPSSTGTAQTQRDFFLYPLNYDSYNLERIDYARGPNAVLFGNGDYSGTVNAVSRVAQTDRNFAEAKVAAGSWANYRGTLDANYVLVPQRVALRLDTLYQDRDGWRKFEYEKRKAATLAATWNITPTTQLRVQGEYGSTKKNNPLYTFNDRFTGWDGSTTYNTLFNAANPLAGTEQNPGSATQPYFVYLPYSSSVVNLAGQSRTVGGNNSGTTLVSGVPVVGGGAGLSSQPYNGGFGLPPGEFNNAIAGSYFRPPSRSFAVASDNPSFGQDFQSVSLFLTHRFTDNLFASIDANQSRERRSTEYTNSRDLVNTWIDLNQTLPNGSRNPEFLQPYAEGYRSIIEIGNDNRAVRASLAYLLNQTKFGSYSFNIAWQNTDTKFHLNPYFYGITNRQTDHRNLSTAGNPEPEAIVYRYYWNQASLPTPTPPTVTDYRTGNTYHAGWITAIGGAPSISDVKLNTLQAAAKAKLFGERLHLLAAIRHDDYAQHVLTSKVRGDYPTNWDAQTLYWRPDAPADYGALSYIPKDANGVATGAARPATARPRAANGLDPLPQYAADRFQDDYTPPDVKVKQTTYTLGGVGFITKTLSVYYNYATTFNPSPARQNINGAFYGPQTANEWSLGVRKTFFGERLNLSLDYYNGKQLGQVYDQGSGPGTDLNTIILASPTPSAGTAPASQLGNMRGLPPTPREFDTRDSLNHGYEFELTANPTREWRVSFNAALPTSIVANLAPDYISYFNANQATLRQILTDTGVVINATTNRAAVDASIPASRLSPDAASAAASWNNIQNNLPNIGALSQPALVTPKYSLNLFTDYKFSSGLLKNVRLGGGVNYRGRRVVGYRGADTMVNPAAPTTAIDNPAVDGTTPVTVGGYASTTLVIGYTLRLRDWHPITFDLKVDNVFDYAAPIFTSTVQRPPNGDLSNPARLAAPAQYYYLTPRNYTLTATYKF